MSHDPQFKRPSTGQEEVSDGTRTANPIINTPNGIAEDPEMKEFIELCKGPAKKPAYHRGFFYDFKMYKTKRQFGPL